MQAVPGELHIALERVQYIRVLVLSKPAANAVLSSQQRPVASKHIPFWRPEELSIIKVLAAVVDIHALVSPNLVSALRPHVGAVNLGTHMRQDQMDLAADNVIAPSEGIVSRKPSD